MQNNVFLFLAPNARTTRYEEAFFPLENQGKKGSLRLLKAISSEQSAATVVFEDNLGAVSTSRSNKITPHTKHIDIKFHHIRSLVADKVVDVKYIKTGFQKADILTKSLSALKFVSNRLMLLGE